MRMNRLIVSVKAIRCFETSESTLPKTLCHISERRNFQHAVLMVYLVGIWVLRLYIGCLFSCLADYRRCDALASFYQILSLRSFVYVPPLTVKPPRYAAYDGTLA
jgi:hypothetical protein